MTDLLKVKLEINDMKKDLSQVQEKVNGIDKKVEKGFSEIKDLITNLDNKFSAKWVEKVICWAARILGTMILLGAAGAIIQAGIHFTK